MIKDLEMISYADASVLSEFFTTVNKNDKKHLISYQVNVKKFDELIVHKLLFDYKIIAFRKKDENDFIVFKISELEEKNAMLTLWSCNLEDTQLFNGVIEKIKEEYGFYNWNYINIEVLRKQLNEQVKKFIEKYTSDKPVILRSNTTQNDRFCYKISLKQEE